MGDALDAIFPYGLFFAYFHCAQSVLAMAGEEAAFPPLPAEGLLGQSPSLLPGKAEAGGGAARGGPHLGP